MPKLGCAWLTALLLTAVALTITSCASRWDCQYIYDSDNKKRFSCHAKSKEDFPPIPAPSKEELEAREIDDLWQ